MGQIKIILALLLIVVCHYVAEGGSKYTDENRPYEFGFTIDGEQHRYEKKDENGIIMGEFGFITADGVYHVTVYATDENGNFKIISMKNIRVKPYPTSPNIGSRQGQALALPSKTSSTTPKPSVTSNQVQLFKQEIKAEPARSCSSCKIPTTTTQAPKVFTEKSLPIYNEYYENKYNTPAQTNSKNFEYEQSLQDKAKQNDSQYSFGNQGQFGNRNSQTPTGQQLSENKNVKPSIELNTPLLGNYPQNFGTGDNNYQQNLGAIQENQQQNPDLNNNYKNYEQNSGVKEQNYPKNLGVSEREPNKYATQVPNVGQVYSENYPQDNNNAIQNYPQGSSVGNRPEQSYPKTTYEGQQVNIAGQIPTKESTTNYKKDKFDTYPHSRNLNNEQTIVPDQSSKPNRHPKSFNEILESVNPEQHGGLPEKPVLVAAQMQIVDKNTDVYHKNPGERDGLPKGLTNDDMKQLLYTFNYTVGFHGHHEEGYTNGAKYGYYYVTGRNGVRTRVDYVADETGFHPKITQEMLDILSDEVPKPETERDEIYGLKGYEFKWIYYPVQST